MEEKRIHELVGTVVSDVNDKTITVLVETYKNDKLYHKRVKYSKKYTAHDEKNRFYYILKNSWGKTGPYKGFIYMSQAYFRAKTISVVIR